MTNHLLTQFYERDLRKFIEEINLFQDEGNLWKTHGSIKNSSGNLALHIIGGCNYLIGTQLGQTGYVWDSGQDFLQKDVKRGELVAELEKLISMILEVLKNVEMKSEYPLIFDGTMRSNCYVLTQLALHLNYHLGQVNYLRRVLE